MLLMDNCGAHGSAEIILELSNIKVVFLPPDTIALIPPMDAGIISTLKARYRKVHYERAIDALDDRTDNIYKSEELVAMKLFREIWDSLTSNIIVSCWNTTELFGSVRNNDTRRRDKKFLKRTYRA